MVITVSPDIALSLLALGALVFVPVSGKLGAVGFLAAGGLLILRRPATIAADCLRYWYIMALPVYCVMSALWSQYPPESFRFGAQLIVTVAIAVAIATRLSPRAFCRALFMLLGIAMLASIAFGNVRNDTGAWLGIFGSKNALAAAAATFVIISVAQMIDRRNSARFRGAALAGAFVGCGILLAAQSTGAVMSVPPILALLLALTLMHRLSAVQKAGIVIFAILLAGLIGLLITANYDALVALLLDKTGKDMTLTGRTELWEIALDFIRERPLFGMGYQAFWVRGHQPAEALWFMFGIDSRGGFNFHNTYLSNAVEIGLVGVTLQVFILYGAAILTGRWALRTRNADATLLFGLVMLVVLISFVEVPVFFQFSLRTVIILCAFIFAIKARRAT
ncbi:O-antigen ligase family protein [Aliiroseovarius sp. YM-037]|uniref:O-antigen ligase family protein n=1 Tax=Aliiroseovarius sp. YM-037 TaxID=3341728 RepID=UPI003A806B35